MIRSDGPRRRRGSNGDWPPKFAAENYKGRNVIARGLCDTKQWRGLAMPSSIAESLYFEPSRLGSIGYATDIDVLRWDVGCCVTPPHDKDPCRRRSSLVLYKPMPEVFAPHYIALFAPVPRLRIAVSSSKTDIPVGMPRSIPRVLADRETVGATLEACRFSRDGGADVPTAPVREPDAATAVRMLRRAVVRRTRHHRSLNRLRLRLGI